MIKNYTSSVPASKSISYIEHRLVSFGASDIYKTYDAGKRLSGIFFTVNVNGRPTTFSLPANVENVYKILKRQVRRPKPGTEDRLREQAERSAWKLLADSIDVDLSLIEINQVEFLQKFLAYAVVDGSTRETLYDRMKRGGYRELEHKPEASS